jgi:hypothetical protein
LKVTPKFEGKKDKFNGHSTSNAPLELMMTPVSISLAINHDVLIQDGVAMALLTGALSNQ